jgi:hypothetical protein
MINKMLVERPIGVDLSNGEDTKDKGEDNLMSLLHHSSMVMLKEWR